MEERESQSERPGAGEQWALGWIGLFAKWAAGDGRDGGGGGGL